MYEQTYRSRTCIRPLVSTTVQKNKSLRGYWSVRLRPWSRALALSVASFTIGFLILTYICIYMYGESHLQFSARNESNLRLHPRSSVRAFQIVLIRFKRSNNRCNHSSTTRPHYRFAETRLKITVGTVYI